MRSVIAALVMLSGSAGATLLDRGGGMVYDTALNLTWLKNANYAAQDLSDTRVAQMLGQVVRGHTVVASDFEKIDDLYYSGRMSAYGAIIWAETLEYGGFSDWLLPVTVQPDPSCSHQLDIDAVPPAESVFWLCRGSPMGYMFYANLGGAPGYGISESRNANLSLFSDIQENIYWSSTDFPYAGGIYSDPPPHWRFDFGTGVQDLTTVTYAYSAWPVRVGDVPEPTTLALLGLGLAGLSRRKRA
jgi:hypothetical protein